MQLVELTTLQRTDMSEKQRMHTDLEERSSQASLLADQNREFMRRMEVAEEKSRQYEVKASLLGQELDALKTTLHALQQTLKSGEERSGYQARDLANKTQELASLRQEYEALRLASAETARKAAVEIETLQESLRVRKEKQYTLLEKAAAADDFVRRTKDEAGSLNDALRTAHEHIYELRARIASEDRSKSSQLEAMNAALREAEVARASIVEMRNRTDAAESDKLKLETELRNAGDNVREMAQKVFAVLERLKLSEMGKTKAIDALKARDNEVVAMKKKVERVAKDAVKDGKAAAALEAELAKLAQELDVRCLTLEPCN
jgi:chromosome segregation ATPase